MKREITLLPKQKQAVESAAKEVILSGSFGSGKSRALCVKCLFLLSRYPNNRGYLCRKTLEDLKKTTLKTLLDGDGSLPPVLTKDLILFHNKQDRLIKLKNNSELYYGPMDINTLKSMNLGFGAVDEMIEISEEEWNVLGNRCNRLSGIPVSQVFGATNPGPPTNWIYNRAKVNPLKNPDGSNRVDFIESNTLDNFYLSPEYLENLKQTLFGFYYQRYVLGMWVGSDDLIYDNFNPQLHIIKNFQIPKNWARYRTIDFGYKNPFACLWIAVAGEHAEKFNEKLRKGDFIIYREIYHTQRTTSINAKRIKEFSKYEDKTDEIFHFSVSDHDAGDRADLEAEGIRTIKANKDILLGIQKVRERLGNDDNTRGEIVRPRMYFFENTLAEVDHKIKLNLETGERNNNPNKVTEEFMSYNWKDGKTNKEEPIDDFNHALDALRYFVMAYDMQNQWANIPFRHI